MSELLRETLEDKVKQETGYQRTRKRQVALMKKRFDVGSKGKITVMREEALERW